MCAAFDIDIIVSIICFRSLFWRVDPEEHDLDLTGALRRAEGARVHARERKQPESDLRLVDEALEHMYAKSSTFLPSSINSLTHGPVVVLYETRHFVDFSTASKCRIT